MTEMHAALLIAVMSGVTILLRFLPFWVYRNRQVPAAVRYLGDTLPSAAIAMLVVYCLRDITPFAAPWGLPELISCAVTAALQVWKRNSIWSILGGTVCYMVLIRLVF